MRAMAKVITSNRSKEIAREVMSDGRSFVELSKTGIRRDGVVYVTGVAKNKTVRAVGSTIVKRSRGK